MGDQGEMGLKRYRQKDDFVVHMKDSTGSKEP